MYSDGLRSNGSTPRHGIVPETPPYNDVVPPSPEISMRLDEAETNVKLLMMEREKLMEVSNGVGYKNLIFFFFFFFFFFFI